MAKTAKTGGVWLFQIMWVLLAETLNPLSFLLLSNSNTLTVTVVYKSLCKCSVYRVTIIILNLWNFQTLFLVFRFCFWREDQRQGPVKARIPPLFHFFHFIFIVLLNIMDRTKEFYSIINCMSQDACTCILQHLIIYAQWEDRGPVSRVWNWVKVRNDHQFHFLSSLTTSLNTFLYVAHN